MHQGVAAAAYDGSWHLSCSEAMILKSYSLAECREQQLQVLVHSPLCKHEAGAQESGGTAPRVLLPGLELRSKRVYCTAQVGLPAFELKQDEAR
jgi:hypothetical protein